LRFILFISFFLGCFCGYSQINTAKTSISIPVFRQVSYPFLPSITSDYFYFSEDGLMWFSTANGLSSFDGTSVMNHSTQQQANELTLNRVDCIVEDEFHNFYLGSGTGLIYYNRKNKTFSPIIFTSSDRKEKQDFAFMSLFRDNNGIVYGGTYSRGLVIYNPENKKSTHLNLDPSKQDNWKSRNSNTIRCFAPHYSDSSKLWVGSFDGIYLYNKKTKTFERNFIVKNPASNSDGSIVNYYDVHKMEVLNDSIIWFNSWSGGFSEYNVNSGNVIVYMQRKFPGLRKNIPVLAIIPSFIKLSNDYFLLGGQTRVTGLFEIKSKTNHPLNITGIENAIDVVMFLAEDKKGNIWLLRNGMLYTSIPEYSRLKTFDISKQFTTNKNANELRGIYYNKETHKYYGAARFSSGVYVFDSSFNLVELIPAPLYTNKYTFRETCTDRITMDGSGRLWVTGHETYIKIQRSNKFDHIRNVLPSLSWIENKGEFSDILTTKEGNIVMRGAGSIMYIINHKTLKTDTVKIPQFNYKESYQIGLPIILYDSLRSFCYFSNDHVCVQYNLRTGAIKNLAYKDLLGAEHPAFTRLRLALDRDGKIWAMRTNFGIRIIDPLSLTCIDSFKIGSRGLKSENYFSIVNGGQDFMFLQGQNGVIVYNHKLQQAFPFDNSNGLAYPVAISLLYTNDHLFISHLDKVQYYNTALFSENEFILEPRINIILSDTIVVYERASDDSIRLIRLKYDQNNLRISFSAPEFIFPERIEYAYQLSGFEDRWQYASYFKREVSYTSLAPGKYIFRIKAQKLGGNWDIVPVEYIILISPAWWQTKLFNILLLAFLTGLIILIFRLRVQAIRKKATKDLIHGKELLELEAKALRAQMNPHFIFNSLNSIKSLIQQNENEKSVTYLTTFSKLIRTLLNNADKKEISLYDEIETCKLYLQLEAMRFDTKFSYAVDVDNDIDLKSIQVPALIIQPFIENAIWHGIMPRNSTGHVSLNVIRKNGSIQVAIDDDGIGREASAQNRSASNLTHQSKGVNLTQSRLELNNLLQQRQAKLEVIDKKDEHGTATGTTVIINIKEELS